MSAQPHLLTELVQFAERGPRGLAELAERFLLEVPLQRAESLKRPAEAATPGSRSTTSFEHLDLLDLPRLRATGDGRVFFLSAGAVAGRGADCQVRLDVDSEALSKQHARFDVAGAAWSLTDLGSKNGTFVDRRQVRGKGSEPLSSFAVVQLGDVRLVFLEPEDLHAILAPVQPAAETTVRALRVELEGLGSRRFLVRYGSGHFLLIDPHGKERDRRKAEVFLPTQAHVLAGDGPYVIGRSRSCEITIKARMVSKQHARVVRQPGRSGWWLEELGSKFGTEVNGERLAAGRPIRLMEWDGFTLGQRAARGQFLDPRGLLEYLSEEAEGR